MPFKLLQTQEQRDTTLAILVSLLEPTLFTQSQYLQSLHRNDWNVEKAAEDLLLAGPQGTGETSRSTGREGGEDVIKKKPKLGQVGIKSWFQSASSSSNSNRVESDKPSCKMDDPESILEEGYNILDKDARLPKTLKSSQSPLPYQRSTSITNSTLSDNSTIRRKPPVDLSTLLGSSQSSSSKTSAHSRPKSKPLPPLILTPSTLPHHSLPLVLLRSPLSPSLASALYLTMMRESEKWKKNHWFLAGRMVESGHTMASYAKKGGGYGEKLGVRYFYSGNEYDVWDYPDLLAKAADLVEDAVNEYLDRSPRYPLEWKGRWRANVCGTNRYDGAASSVGWHADQLTYLGPYATIASLSLGTPRAFRLRQTASTEDQNLGHQIRTYEITLGHNSLCLMTAGCQERYKHTVPKQKALDLFRPAWDEEQLPIPVFEQKSTTSRINITFRFYREDFHPEPKQGPYGIRQGTPICKCGLPTLLRADQKAKVRMRLAMESESGKRQVKEVEEGASFGIAPSKSPSLEDDDKDEMGINVVKTKSIQKQDVTNGPLQDKLIESEAISGEGSERVEREGMSVQVKLVKDDMAYFWQCQSPSQTGDLNGCGFFKLLDMRAEGRGPCISWS